MSLVTSDVATRKKGRVITALLFYSHFSMRLSPLAEVLISKCNMQIGEVARYGKYSAVLGFCKRPQDVVVGLSLV